MRVILDLGEIYATYLIIVNTCSAILKQYEGRLQSISELWALQSSHLHCSVHKLRTWSPCAGWTCSQLPGWRLLPRHKRSLKKTVLGRHSMLLVSRTHINFCDRTCSAAGSCLVLSADGPQTAGLVIKPFQTVAEDVDSVIGTKVQC